MIPHSPTGIEPIHKYMVFDTKTPYGVLSIAEDDSGKRVSGVGRDKTAALVDLLKMLFQREDKKG